ncbi:MAG: hypothetical protein RLZZ210_1805 [Pseudomonadota bacterium]|jgi:putative N6-adenine-specific DNA methylase
MLSFFCPCPKGLEEVLTNELLQLTQDYPKYNINSVKKMSGGVAFKGDMLSCYAVNLFSRIASRVLLLINTAPCRTEDDIYFFAKKQQWDTYFTARQTIRLDINAHHSSLTSLNFVNLRVKDAICDAFRSKVGIRPSVDTENPDVRIMTFLDKNMCSLYIDTSGDSLFKRGWRQEIGEAPIKENLAAGILYLSGWYKDTSQALLDPMCGSGTFLIEAVNMALNVPAGANREFGFETLKIHQTSLWQQLKVFANKQRQNALSTQINYITGSDISEKMLAMAEQNAHRAGVKLKVQVSDARSIEKPSASGILVANPPYGERISTRGAAPKTFIKNKDGIVQRPADDTSEEQKNQEHLAKDQAFHSEWASNLKKNFSGWQAYILSADLELPSHMRLKPKQKIPLFNGNLECRLFAFDMIDGSMRKS